MSNPMNAIAPFEPDAAKRLLDQFTVSQAADLALSGSYSSAESLLKDLVQQPEAPTEVLDLLAKIYVQQGRALEASELWRRALEKDPGNLACQAALVRLNRMQQRPLRFTILWPALFAFVVIVICLTAFQIQSARRNAEMARLEDLIKQASAAAAKSSDVSRLSQSVDSLKIQQAAVESQIEKTHHEVQGVARASAGIAKTTNNILSMLSRQNSLVLKPLTPQGQQGSRP
jgi:tetratricopeptide (TPR) repeat protein